MFIINIAYLGDACCRLNLALIRQIVVCKVQWHHISIPSRLQLTKNLTALLHFAVRISSGVFYLSPNPPERSCQDAHICDGPIVSGRDIPALYPHIYKGHASVAYDWPIIGENFPAGSLWYARTKIQRCLSSSQSVEMSLGVYTLLSLAWLSPPVSCHL